MNAPLRSRVAIACQGGGSHTAFTAGVLHELLGQMPDDVEIVAISGTSGGAICAALAWDGLIRDNPGRGIAQLERFWSRIAANQPWDRLMNDWMQHLVRLRNNMVLPEVSPYSLPPWGQDLLREILVGLLDFEELTRLARSRETPAIHIGAVEVLTGHFEVFTGPSLCVECLLASAAVPELFRAVEVPGWGSYWDGLFSQNPPIHDLTDHRINELWVIQINPPMCTRVPTDTQEINDRRNELAGNISLEQELHFIEVVNRMILRKQLVDENYHPIHIGRIVLDRDLDYASKLDRRTAFLDELHLYGRAKGRWFLKEREAKRHTMEALGVLKAREAADGSPAKPSARLKTR